MENNIIRVTKAQKLECIKKWIPEGMCFTFPGSDDRQAYDFTTDEAIAFIDSEIAQLAKKNSKSSDKQTDAQKQNDHYRELILEYLATLPSDDPGKTCTEIGKAIPELNDFQNQKISALMRPFILPKGDGRISVSTGKKSVRLFKLA